MICQIFGGRAAADPVAMWCGPLAGYEHNHTQSKLVYLSFIPRSILANALAQLENLFLAEARGHTAGSNSQPLRNDRV
jgi:hypothetical protein